LTEHLSREAFKGLLDRQRRSKYGAKASWLDGIRFDSKRERDTYARLKLRADVGEISGLELQVRYPLKVEGSLLGHYVADFVFYDHVLKCLRIIDAKGVRTPLYKWKRKHMKAAYGIDIEEV
jgi:hypothetical protein